MPFDKVNMPVAPIAPQPLPAPPVPIAPQVPIPVAPQPVAPPTFPAPSPVGPAPIPAANVPAESSAQPAQPALSAQVAANKDAPAQNVDNVQPTNPDNQVVPSGYDSPFSFQAVPHQPPHRDYYQDTYPDYGMYNNYDYYAGPPAFGPPAFSFQLDPTPDRCFQFPEPGKCKGKHLRWYYAPKLDQCKLFYYGGCDGNDNNFATRVDCEQHCGVGQPKAPRSRPRRPLPDYSSQYDYYYYYEYEEDENATSSTSTSTSTAATTSVSTEETTTITTKNSSQASTPSTASKAQSSTIATRFRQAVEKSGNTSAVAEGAAKKLNARLCARLVDGGSKCKNSEEGEPPMLYYYFDSVEGRCKLFFFKGCQGNDNRFSSRKRCYEVCLGQDDFASVKASR